MFNHHYNTIPYINREIRRKVERYRKKHPNLTFTQAYNIIYKTNYSEPVEYSDTSTYSQKSYSETTSDTFYSNNSNNF